MKKFDWPKVFATLISTIVYVVLVVGVGAAAGYAIKLNNPYLLIASPCLCAYLLQEKLLSRSYKLSLCEWLEIFFRKQIQERCRERI